MKKKGLSDLLTLLIIIILILLLIVIIWIVIKGLIKNEMEVAEIKAGLFAENIDLDDVNITDYQINITLTKGPGKEFLINETIIKKNSSIVFIVDSTDSMHNEINDTKNIIINFSNKLKSKNVNFKLGLVEFRDYNETVGNVDPEHNITCGSGIIGYGNSPSRIHYFPEESSEPFTQDIEIYKSKIASTNFGNGADWPEAHLTAITEAINLDYIGTDLKYLILLTDAPPHAKDCEYPIILGYSLSTGQRCYNINMTDCSDPVTYAGCYHGPETIAEIRDNLISNKFILYYISKNEPKALCSNNADRQMAEATGGKFLYYTESGGVQEILLEIADKITREYETLANWNYISVMFYNETDSYEYKITDVPRPLETRTYSIPDEGEISQYITNVIRIEVYPVALSSRGDKVIGPMLGSWEEEPGVLATMKNFFGF